MEIQGSVSDSDEELEEEDFGTLGFVFFLGVGSGEGCWRGEDGRERGLGEGERVEAG